MRPRVKKSPQKGNPLLKENQDVQADPKEKCKSPTRGREKGLYRTRKGGSGFLRTVKGVDKLQKGGGREG